MSEQLQNQEHGNALEGLAQNEQSKNISERELTAHEKEHGSVGQLEKLQQIVEKQAVSKYEVARSENEHPGQHPVLIRKDIKEVQFHRAMTRVRKKLSVPSRAFSKIVHISVIDKSSELIGKTIARPSGMLTGAILAFVGTSALLWVTRYNGYEYNYLVVLLLFVGGMFIGVAGEVLWRLLRNK
jgi:hypothetical protein